MAQFGTYNPKSIIAGAYYSGAQIVLWSDTARTIPIDLSGCTITMALKKTWQQPVVFEFSTIPGKDGQIVLTDAVNGVFNIIGTNMNIEPYTYVLDISFLFYSGENKKYIRGTWVIVPTAQG